MCERWILVTDEHAVLRFGTPRVNTALLIDHGGVGKQLQRRRGHVLSAKPTQAVWAFILRYFLWLAEDQRCSSQSIRKYWAAIGLHGREAFRLVDRQERGVDGRGTQRQFTSSKDDAFSKSLCCLLSFDPGMKDVRV